MGLQFNPQSGVQAVTIPVPSKLVCSRPQGKKKLAACSRSLAGGSSSESEDLADLIARRPGSERSLYNVGHSQIVGPKPRFETAEQQQPKIHQVHIEHFRMRGHMELEEPGIVK